MILEIIQKINEINEGIFAPADGLIESVPVAPWVQDALIDSLHMVPFLLLIFFIIGFIEYFYSEKAETLADGSAKSGPIVGSLLASVPQCGFSVIASTLYTKRLITKGTLLAVYLATSDEALPVLLAEPDKLNLVLPLLGTKIFIAVCAGYLIDLVLPSIKKKSASNEDLHKEADEGCCHHEIAHSSKTLWLHPIVHTLNIFIFILIVTLCINYAVMRLGGEENLGAYLLNNSPLQPVITAVFGLVPNCAVSIALTLMYMKGAIGFGSVISGLCSSAGLGLLVLVKKNTDKRDTLELIAMLLAVSIASGLIIQFLYN